MEFLKQFFTWWNGQTLGTRFFTWRKGERVGKDESGNVYYRSKQGRRWVIYIGYADPTTIPPGWHSWMHHRSDVAPADEAYAPKSWELPHEPNHTGTARAYRPPGSIIAAGKPAPVQPDYEPWKPQ